VNYKDLKYELLFVNMNNNSVIIFIIYVVILFIFTKRWKDVSGKVGNYSLNSDIGMLLKDSVIFDKKLSRESANKFGTDVEKCEWALEKMRDLFQFFNVADVSIWPYQIIVSLFSSVFIIHQLQVRASLSMVLSTAFMLFVMIDLPRKFFSFHKNALVSNKALNIYSFYFKNMKGKDITEKDVY